MQVETPIFLRYGGAEKDTTEMTKEELEQMAKSILRRAREKAFLKVGPLFLARMGKYLKNGLIIELLSANKIDNACIVHHCRA